MDKVIAAAWGVVNQWKLTTAVGAEVEALERELVAAAASDLSVAAGGTVEAPGHSPGSPGDGGGGST